MKGNIVFHNCREQEFHLKDGFEEEVCWLNLWTAFESQYDNVCEVFVFQISPQKRHFSTTKTMDDWKSVIVKFKSFLFFAKLLALFFSHFYAISWLSVNPKASYRKINKKSDLTGHLETSVSEIYFCNVRLVNLRQNFPIRLISETAHLSLVLHSSILWAKSWIRLQNFLLNSLLKMNFD